MKRLAVYRPDSHQYVFALRCLVLCSLGLLTSARAMGSESESIEVAQRVEKLLPPHIGACVLVMDDGQVIFEQAFGLADVQTNSPCTPQTNFRMASVSKQFTAAAVMLLVERNQLSVDDTLDKFFPGFPEYGRQITVEHLLTHTSGLPAYEELIPAGTTLQLDDLDVLQLLLDTKAPRFEPGSTFEYSNSAYVLLGLIVEVAAKRPFHEFMHEEIFQTAGMTNSVIFQHGLNEVTNRAYGHELKNGNWTRADQSVTSAARGDGCVYASLDDYAKWLHAIDAQQVLKPATWNEIFRPRVEGRDGHYGFGWFIDTYRGELRVYHNGSSRGFRLTSQRFPERRAAVLVQLNGDVDEKQWDMRDVGEKIADLTLFESRPN